MDPGLQHHWARLLVVSLADAGVRDVVLSPGSRSTPLVLATVGEPRLRVHDAIDERAGAFFALGQARITGRPSLLVCTSGSAGANYYPAVVEAAASHLPLLVLTADRPVELAACGANQTIDQLGLYGTHARAFFDLGTAQSAPRALRALRRTAAQAALRSTWPDPGPVHLNARLAKPLEPPVTGDDSADRSREAVDAALNRPVPRAVSPPVAPDAEAVGRLAAAFARAPTSLIVAGPAPTGQGRCRALLAQLAKRTGAAVYAEATSQLRFGPDGVREESRLDALDLLLGDEAFAASFAPSLVVQIGRAPTSGAFGRWLAASPPPQHWVIGARGWHDPQSTATEMLVADPREVLTALLSALPDRSAGPPSAPVDCQAAESLAWKVIHRVADDAEALSEAATVRAVLAELSDGALLAVGNSLPIRHLDTWCRGRATDLAVVSQRGASGIDGLISGAAGAASRWRGPTVLLLGDVSFAHDLSGLALARRVATPLAVVVLQNAGGRIFEQLPVAGHDHVTDRVFDHWLTPPALDIGAGAAAYGLPYARAAHFDQLRRALTAALARDGASVVEAAVAPGDAVARRQRLQDALAASLAEARAR